MYSVSYVVNVSIEYLFVHIPPRSFSKKNQFSARFCSSFLQFERTVEIAWRQRGDLAVSTTFGMVSLYACHIVIIDFLCLLKVFFIHKDILKTLFDTLNLPGIFICSTSFGFNRGASREKKRHN